MTSSTIERLRAKTISKPVPVRTAQDREAYVAQLRSLGADDTTIARLTRKIPARSQRP